MNRVFSQRRDVQASNQFIGSEFSVSLPRPNKILNLKQIFLQMGTETKTWRIIVVDADGSQIALIQQSFDTSGQPGSNEDESVILRGPDIEVFLDVGQQVQVITTGATSAMTAILYFEELSTSG